MALRPAPKHDAPIPAPSHRQLPGTGVPRSDTSLPAELAASRGCRGARARAALGSQPRGRGGRGGGGGGAGISLGAALTAPLCRSPSGGARWAAQSAFVRAVSHRITRIMRPPGPGRRAGRHRVATGGSRGRAAPPAPAPAREIPIEAAPPAPAQRRMARGRVNGAAAAAGAGPGRAVGGGARALFMQPKPLRAARPPPRPGRALRGWPRRRPRPAQPSGRRRSSPAPPAPGPGGCSGSAPSWGVGPRPPRKMRAPSRATPCHLGLRAVAEINPGSPPSGGGGRPGAGRRRACACGGLLPGTAQLSSASQRL